MSVFYKTTGKTSNPALILLHSGAMTHQEWQPHIQYWEKFYYIIAIDQPGHGQTPMLHDKLRIRDCGEAVLSVMQTLQLNTAYFCGSSMGGATTLWLARHHPHIMRKMILYRVNYRKNQETFSHTNQMANPLYWKQVGMAQYMAKQHQAQGDLDSWKTVVARVSQALDPKDSDHDHTLSDLEQMNIPCLLVCGDRDPLVPLSDLYAMHTALNADLWIMPHASHVTATNTWRADSFSQEVHRFLTRQRNLSL